MCNNNIDISLLVTVHNEGALIHSTLNSIERCRIFANSKGISCEYIFVLDCCDSQTKNILQCHPVFKKCQCTIIEVKNRDLGASRNDGISQANGKVIAVLDGDDYFSENWLERGWFYLHEYGKETILHPEFVINFGAHRAYCWQVEQCGEYYQESGLLSGNFWTSWTIAFKEVYVSCPYQVTRPSATGFGYEDWHWNCETIANGYKHRLAWGTIGFYRRKKQSLVNSTFSSGAIIPKSKLFDFSHVKG
ncbi:glycosyltransferase family 2 protein [Aeromonas veronii]|uniref:glycosyltransferase family 2 protein n=1 Tax=Aeromonas veronii TaxID=654 RepID=UPI002417B26E|nr:glycosyltransferase family 2 protein [Aeromonas veronii]WFO52669.1 glycosyltransferase [Aeromonas veronii]